MSSKYDDLNGYADGAYIFNPNDFTTTSTSLTTELLSAIEDNLDPRYANTTGDIIEGDITVNNVTVVSNLSFASQSELYQTKAFTDEHDAKITSSASKTINISIDESNNNVFNNDVKLNNNLVFSDGSIQNTANGISNLATKCTDITYDSGLLVTSIANTCNINNLICGNINTSHLAGTTSNVQTQLNTLANGVITNTNITTVNMNSTNLTTTNLTSTNLTSNNITFDGYINDIPVTTFADISIIEDINDTLNTFKTSQETTNTNVNTNLTTLNTFKTSQTTTNTNVNTNLTTLNTFKSSQETTNTNVNTNLTTLNTFKSSQETTNTNVNTNLDTLNTFKTSQETTNTNVNTNLDTLNTFKSSQETTNTNVNNNLTTLNTKTTGLSYNTLNENNTLTGVTNITGTNLGTTTITGGSISATELNTSANVTCATVVLNNNIGDTGIDKMGQDDYYDYEFYNMIEMASKNSYQRKYYIGTLGNLATANNHFCVGVNDAGVPDPNIIFSMNTDYAYFFGVKQPLVPVGSIQMYAGLSSNIPVGYLLCNGASLSKTTYTTLWNVIKDLYLAGRTASTTNFYLPDLRGMFVRGIGTNTTYAGVVGGSTGTYQADSVQRHTHTYSKANNTINVQSAGGVNSSVWDNSNDTDNTDSKVYDVNGTLLTDETRPHNISMSYIIKY